MQHFIYPKGITGEQLSIIMKELDGIDAHFIDDSIEELSLEVQRHNIKPNDIVHLALGAGPNYKDNFARITHKLQLHNIPYVTNTREFVVRYVEKIKSDFENLGITKFVGLSLDGFICNKHFGRLGIALANRFSNNTGGGGGQNGIIYLCADRDSYAQYLKEQCAIIKCFYISGDYWELLNVDIMVITSDHRQMGLKFNAANTIAIYHGLMDFSDTNDPYNLQLLKQTNYIGVAGPKFTPSPIPGLTIINCGYVGFDLPYEKIQNLAKLKHFERDSVLFMPRPYSEDSPTKEAETMLPYIRSLLPHFRVIFKVKEPYVTQMDAVIEEFKGESNFFIDRNPGASAESYLRSFCMVCSSTSAKRSYPMLSLCPSIVLPFLERLKYAKVIGDKVDESIGINLDTYITPQEMLEIVRDIHSNLDKWNTKIQKYRDENIYNFGYASEALAEDIVKILTPNT